MEGDKKYETRYLIRITVDCFVITLFARQNVVGSYCSVLSNWTASRIVRPLTTSVGPSGLPILMDTFVRLTKSPVVSIAKIRGCVRGVSSEFVLACDMRFASRDNTRLGQPQVGVGVHPGGGTERLPHLVGHGRASK